MPRKSTQKAPNAPFVPTPSFSHETHRAAQLPPSQGYFLAAYDLFRLTPLRVLHQPTEGRPTVETLISVERRAIEETAGVHRIPPPRPSIVSCRHPNFPCLIRSRRHVCGADSLEILGGVRDNPVALSDFLWPSGPAHNLEVRASGLCVVDRRSVAGQPSSKIGLHHKTAFAHLE